MHLYSPAFTFLHMYSLVALYSLCCTCIHFFAPVFTSLHLYSLLCTCIHLHSCVSITMIKIFIDSQKPTCVQFTLQCKWWENVMIMTRCTNDDRFVLKHRRQYDWINCVYLHLLFIICIHQHSHLHSPESSAFIWLQSSTFIPHVFTSIHTRLYT